MNTSHNNEANNNSDWQEWLAEEEAYEREEQLYLREEEKLRSLSYVEYYKNETEYFKQISTILFRAKKFNRDDFYVFVDLLREEYDYPNALKFNSDEIDFILSTLSEYDKNLSYFYIGGNHDPSFQPKDGEKTFYNTLPNYPNLLLTSLYFSLLPIEERISKLRDLITRYVQNVKYERWEQRLNKKEKHILELFRSLNKSRQTKLTEYSLFLLQQEISTGNKKDISSLRPELISPEEYTLLKNYRELSKPLQKRTSSVVETLLELE